MELIISIVSLILFVIILVSIYGTHQETKKARQVQQEILTLLLLDSDRLNAKYVDYLNGRGLIDANQRALLSKAKDT